MVANGAVLGIKALPGSKCKASYFINTIKEERNEKLRQIAPYMCCCVAYGDKMKNFKIVSNYLDNEELRKSFNMLSDDIFKLDMEPWYQAGFSKIVIFRIRILMKEKSLRMRR
ncbi:hypothetical protein ACI2OX_16760 [Bacillus sp. N9]